MTNSYPSVVSGDEFKSKRVLVTGGTKGVGEAIVRRFELSGASVATTARFEPAPGYADYYRPREYSFSAMAFYGCGSQAWPAIIGNPEAIALRYFAGYTQKWFSFDTVRNVYSACSSESTSASAEPKAPPMRLFCFLLPPFVAAANR